MTEQIDTLIIGGGLAGLACAVCLSRQGHAVTLLEATDRVGGRVRSDVVDGFVLDHGFQVLLTAYPACQELLDYDRLRLGRFDPGALVRSRGRFATLVDPWRRPSQIFATAMANVGTLGDKLRIGRLRRLACSGTLQELYQRTSDTTENRLRQLGFTPGMIDSFFRPFLGGVMLDESLTTSSRMLEFVFRMFASGDVGLPADGMAAIARQLADQLPAGTIRFQQSVVAIDYPRVTLAGGDTWTARHIVVATESDAAAKLLGLPTIKTAWRGTTTIYYAASQPPDPRKMLMLRGDERGPVQSAVVLSNVAPQYAPPGQALISVSIGEGHQESPLDPLDAGVRSQLRNWFGECVDSWRRLRCFRIPYGLPVMDLENVAAALTGPELGAPANVFVCGDHRETPSIQGALHSGIRVARMIAK